MDCDIMLIGPATRDENIDYTGKRVIEYGGPVYFGSFAARAVGADVGIVLKVNPEDMDVPAVFQVEDDRLRVVPSDVTTRMLNTYYTKDRERRLTECMDQSGKIRMHDIPESNCPIYYLAGLMNGDFESGMIEMLHKRGSVAVNVQSFIRYNDNGMLHFRAWKDEKADIPNIDYLKLNAWEAMFLTGESSLLEAAQALSGKGIRETIITNNKEVMMYDGHTMHRAPIKTTGLTGRTGRGDTAFGIYLAKRAMGSTADEALLYAAAATSIKIAKPGPLEVGKEELDDFIRQHYRENS